ncbi:uncharacterized protein N7498_010883 [Penicillium cinerascens]|uniref:BZIP domain-containing protein n=1 Tax=Penicillium cinerascens TaxID=70096 RepID=A0A9W9J876_9EURO|nr:uncharacterized protein N7498_010883 [Penicillium cinerascens]KAJ5191898.1 hypothetical protein N7498_010883 [Penicillium cinerascens]
MKTAKSPKSPNSDDSLDQKEDPLERRRLQNRLSQRNHRRKIRDRIAKLQERVIANELRAAAALNGWGHPYVPSPLLSSRHIPPNSSFNIDSRHPSPLTAEPSSQFTQPYTPAPWSRHMSFPATSGLQGDQTCFPDGGLSTESMCSVPSAPNWVENAGIEPSERSSEENFHDVFDTGNSLPSEQANNQNQPLYYVATETALPQILQVLSTISPQSKIIVLVPPDSAFAATAGYPSPAPTLLGNGMEPLSPLQMNASLGCQCQMQSSTASSTAQMSSGPWTVPGTYTPRYPPHKMQSSPGGGLSGMRL